MSYSEDDYSQVGEDLGHFSLNSLSASILADLLLSQPLLLLGVLKDQSRSSLNNLADGLLLAGNLSSDRVLSDGGVGSFVNIFERFATKSLLPLAELSLEISWLFTLEQIVVLLDVDTHDVLKMLLSAEVCLRLLLLFNTATLLLTNSCLRLLPSETREALLVVRNVEATIAGTLHGTENSVTGGGSDETNIKVSLEWASFAILVLNVVQFAIGSGYTSKLAIDSLILEQSTGEKKTGSVGGGIVGETAGDTELLELAGVSSSDGNISLNGGVVD